MAEMNEEIERELEREELRLTSVRKRALASVIDELFISILLLAVLWESFTAAETLEDTISLTNAFVLEFMAMKIIYQTFFL
ncbi:MAG: RDD family protein, partial [Sulfurimonadaceae bacterium]|nr:RDD family protein [Sulfurimonadaceae bacterium]